MIEKKLEKMDISAVIELYTKSIKDIKEALNILNRDPDEDDVSKAVKILTNRIRKHNNLSWSR